MRILYAGTPDIAVPSLERVAAEFDVCGVLTNPDKMKGRGKKVLPPPVKIKALELGIPVFQFPSLRSEAREAVSSLNPDILVVFAYGRIFGPRFLSLFKYGGVNVHPSLLPKYRGSSPILSAILNGEKETGITVQRIALEMDTGDILSQVKLPLTGKETTLSLSETASEMGAELLVKVLHSIEDGNVQAVPQNDLEATYCGKIEKKDGLINWLESAEQIERKIRAFNPWPVCYTFTGGKRLNILEAEIADYNRSNSGNGTPGKILGVDKNKGILIQTGNGVIAVRKLQLQSKKAMDWKTFKNGMPKIIGSVLGGSQ